MLAALVLWLIGWGKSVTVHVLNLFVDMFQFALDNFVDFASWVLGQWPAAPNFPDMVSTPGGVVYAKAVQTLNWVFPLSYFVSLVQFMIAAILAYLVIAPLARWVKVMK